MIEIDGPNQAWINDNTPICGIIRYDTISIKGNNHIEILFRFSGIIEEIKNILSRHDNSFIIWRQRPVLIDCIGEETYGNKEEFAYIVRCRLATFPELNINELSQRL